MTTVVMKRKASETGTTPSSAKRRNQARQILSTRADVGSRKVKSLTAGSLIHPNAIGIGANDPHYLGAAANRSQSFEIATILPRWTQS